MQFSVKYNSLRANRYKSHLKQTDDKIQKEKPDVLGEEQTEDHQVK
jgi:hypothetical protein